MFQPYGLRDDLGVLRDDHVPDLQVLECEDEFEAMPSDWLYELALVTEAFEPATVPDEWIPADAPDVLRRLTDEEPAIGLPGDGGVTWTRQTDPALVFVKPRLSGAPPDFRDFLVAEAILQCHLDHPETFLKFFGEEYHALQGAAEGDPDLAYRLGVSLFEGWQGLRTRGRFRDWAEAYPRLHGAWDDAGARLGGRIEELPALLASGSMKFGAATELACSAIKHDLELPPPFGALDVGAFREHGATYAVRWTEKTIAQLDRDPA